MPTFVDELSLKLSAKDEMSAKLKKTRKAISDTEKEMAKARAEFGKTGAPEAAKQLKALEQRWQALTREQADNRKANAANEAAMKRLRVEAERSQTSLAKLGRGWTKASSVFNNNLVAGASIAGLTMWGRNAVNTYASVQDAADAQTASFGRFGDALIAWGNTMGDQLNLSQAQVYAATQSFAVMADTAGLSNQALVDFSTGLTERAANAASYFGGSVEDAITAFSAALRGESEPARRYGVMLDDMSLRQQALTMGIVQTTKTALTPQQRVLAAHALILRQTERVIGDIDRTADSMGNTMKDNAQQTADFQASAGELVAKGLQPMMSAGNSALDKFNALPDPMKQAATAIGIFGTAALIATPRILAMNQALAASKYESLVGLLSARKGEIITGVAAIAGITAINAMGNGDTVGLYDNDQGIALRNVIQPGAYGTFNNVGGAIRKAILPGMGSTDLEESQSTVAKLDAVLADLVANGRADKAATQFSELERQAVAWGGTAEDLRRVLPGYAQATNEAASATNATGDAHGYAAWKAREQAAAESALAGELSGIELILARRDAFRAYQDALDTFVKKPTLENGEVVDRALLGWSSMFKKPEKQAKAFASGFDQIASAVEKSGVSDKISRLILDPLREANTLSEQIIGLYTPQTSAEIALNNRIYAKGVATGGPIVGPGSGTSDTAGLFALSNGEWVMRAAASSAMRSTFGSDVMSAINNFDRAPHLLIARLSAPKSAGTRIVVKAGTSQTMTTHVTAHGQIDYELAQRRMARQAAREARARFAGSR